MYVISDNNLLLLMINLWHLFKTHKILYYLCKLNGFFCIKILIKLNKIKYLRKIFYFLVQKKRHYYEKINIFFLKVMIFILKLWIFDINPIFLFLRHLYHENKLLLKSYDNQLIFYYYLSIILLYFYCLNIVTKLQKTSDKIILSV